MAALSDTFRSIHRLRSLARDLQEEINRAPLQLKARQNVVTKHTKARDDAKETLKKLHVATREREADLKAQHKQIERYREQLSGAVDQKQYDTLKHEITAGEARCLELEEKIINTMTEAEDLSARIPEFDQAAAKAQTDLKTFEQGQNERLANQNAELQKTLDELKVAEVPLDGEVLIEYKRRVASYGADALASTVGNSCSHCHTSIAQQVLLNLNMNRFLTCTSCYRVLYLPE